MTWWQRISMLQSHPQDLGLDDAGRIVLRMNVMATKQPSLTTVEELIKILVLAGVGVYGGAGGTIFNSSAATLPTGNGPYLMIVDTGGPAGIYQHNEDAPAYARPTFAIDAHAKTFSAARTMWKAAYDALSVVKNQNITP